MCTAVTYKTTDHYFGRNLDLEHSYHETVAITPRNYPLIFRKQDAMPQHYAMIGMATVSSGYPLYYEATNEYGLSAAALNFPGNAVYMPEDPNKINITPFEFIPWLLAQCKTAIEAKNQLLQVNITDIPFSDELPLTPLHWIVTDNNNALTVEPLQEGLKIYDNPIGVLTNNPTFEFHMQNLSNYLNLTSEEPTNRFSDKVDLCAFSRGMGAIGLPGDLSSQSRFVKAAFTKLNSLSGTTESESISQFFHILNSVAQQRGCVRLNGKFEKTIYTSCCNTGKGIYYYTTYENSQITAIEMHCEDLERDNVITFPLVTGQQIRYDNKKSCG